MLQSLTPLAAILGQIPTTVYSADEVVAPYIYVFYAAFVVAFIFTPIMQSIANYYGIIDEPDNKRARCTTLPSRIWAAWRCS